jgi:hypothetical protein
MRCWQQIAQFKALVRHVLTEMGPIPLQGVTDGSNAQPGDIGEYLQGNAQLNYAAYPTNTLGNVAPLVIPPGDWDIWSSASTTTAFGTVIFYLNPLPTGISNAMEGLSGAVDTATATTQLNAVFSGQMARGSFTVPTLMNFAVEVAQSSDAALLAGQFALRLEARRVR